MLVLCYGPAPPPEPRTAAPVPGRGGRGAGCSGLALAAVSSQLPGRYVLVYGLNDDDDVVVVLGHIRSFRRRT